MSLSLCICRHFRKSWHLPNRRCDLDEGVHSVFWLRFGYIVLSLRFNARIGQCIYIPGSPCYFDVAYQHWPGTHNYLGPLLMLSLTLLHVLPSSLQKMWVGRSFPRVFLPEHTACSLGFHTVLEHTSIFMKVVVIWKVVSRWCSFLVLSIWHFSYGSTEIFENLSSYIRMFEISSSIQNIGAQSRVNGISLHIPSPFSQCFQGHVKRCFRGYSMEFSCKVKHTIIPLSWETLSCICFQLHERTRALKDGLGTVLFWSHVSATFLMFSPQRCKHFRLHDRSCGL